MPQSYSRRHRKAPDRYQPPAELVTSPGNPEAGDRDREPAGVHAPSSPQSSLAVSLQGAFNSVAKQQGPGEAQEAGKMEEEAAEEAEEEEELEEWRWEPAANTSSAMAWLRLCTLDAAIKYYYRGRSSLSRTPADPAAREQPRTRTSLLPLPADSKPPCVRSGTRD